MRRAAAPLLSALAAAGFFASVGPASAAYRLVPFASGFASPVFLASTPADPKHVYVVEQRGVVKRVALGSRETRTFLDMRDLVQSPDDPGGGFEQGLFSLAFHPSYRTNRRLYVNYTNAAGDVVVASYAANRTRTRVSARTRRRLARIAHPERAQNHNGGTLAFARNGSLYLSVGDGGTGGAPAQRLRTGLGKLLRVDAADGGWRVAALGLRNPWRFSVDRGTGRFYVADVGQSGWEEVDVFRVGTRVRENYGWPRFEGDGHLYDASVRLYAGSSRRDPIHEYAHSRGRCSITGGYVYRATRIAAAVGRYFFGDWCTGEVWSFRYRNGRKSDVRRHPNLTVPDNLSSFGEGPRGGLYLVSQLGGRVFRLGWR